MKNLVVDCNIPIIATEQIGEAWAVVILEQIALNNLPDSHTTVLDLLEILDAYWARESYYEGKSLYRHFRKLLKNRSLTLTKEDFDKSYELYIKHPSTKPRDCLHAAILISNEKTDLFSIDGPSYESLSEIKLITLKTLLSKLNLSEDYVNERDER